MGIAIQSDPARICRTHSAERSAALSQPISSAAVFSVPSLPASTAARLSADFSADFDPPRPMAPRCRIAPMHLNSSAISASGTSAAESAEVSAAISAASSRGTGMSNVAVGRYREQSELTSRLRRAASSSASEPPRINS